MRSGDALMDDSGRVEMKMKGREVAGRRG